MQRPEKLKFDLPGTEITKNTTGNPSTALRSNLQKFPECVLRRFSSPEELALVLKLIMRLKLCAF
jgi:hypothetical protein